MSYEELDDWDPMQDDYSNNSYQRNDLMNEPQCSLHIRNIPRHLQQDALCRIFSKYGRVRNVFIKFKPDTPYTYGFVHFYNEKDAQTALYNLNQNNRFGLHVEQTLYPKTSREHIDPPIFKQRHTSISSHHSAPVEGLETGTVASDAGHHLHPLEIVCSGRSRSVAIVSSNSPVSINKDQPIPSENHSCRIKSTNGSEEAASHYKQPENCVQSASEENKYNLSSSMLNHHALLKPVRRVLLGDAPVQHSQRGTHIGSDCFNVAREVETPRRMFSPVVNNCNAGTCAELCQEDRNSHCHHCICHSSHVSHNSSACKVSNYKCREIYQDDIPHVLCSNGVEAVPNIPDLRKPFAPCGYCGQKGVFVCTSCGEPYCSRDCQLLDWPSHAKVCQHSSNATFPYLHSQKKQPCHKEEAICNNSEVSETGSLFQKTKSEIQLCRNSGVTNIAQHKEILEIPFNNPRNTEASYNCDRKNCASQNHMQEVENDCTNDSRTDIQQHSVSPIGKFKENDSDQDLCKIRGFRGDGPVEKNLDFGSSSQWYMNFGKTYSEVQMQHAKGRGTFRSKALDTITRTPNILMPQRKKASDIQTVTLCERENEEVIVSYLKTPEEFWVSRLKDVELHKEIETALSKLIMNKIVVVNPFVDDLCAALYTDNKLYRCKIVKVDSDSSSCEVNYIDFGNSSITKISDLCYLTGKLLTYPALAVFCGLTDIKPPHNSNSWGESDVEFFNYLVHEKILKAYVVNSSQPKCTIDLITSDGLTVSSVMVTQNNAEWILNENKLVSTSAEGTSCDEISLMYEVPSVLTVLKVNMNVFITPVFSQDKMFAGWPNIKEVLQKMELLESSLQNYKTDEVTHTVEENDIAVALSPQYKLWYRSSVVKRMKHSIKVRYIDYGNEEEVTQLIRIVSEDMKVCSPILFFKTDKLPEDIVRKISKDGFYATVKSLSTNHVELSVKCEEQNLTLHGFPWYFGLSLKPETSSDPKVPEQKVNNKNKSLSALKKSVAFNKQKPTPNKILQKTKLNSFGKHKHTNSFSASDFAKDVLVERALSSTSRTPVIVTWAKNNSEIFVQKYLDIPDLQEMSVEMDKWCNYVESEYVPAESEIVCARYSVDRKWYRSLVLKTVSENCFCVFFIDFGNKENVSVKDIRVLNEKFILPQFSILVHLCDIPLELPIEKLLQTLCDKTLDLEVVNAQTSPKQVVLYEGNKKLFTTVVSGKISQKDEKKTDNEFDKAVSCIESTKSNPPPSSRFLLPDCQYIDFPLGKTTIVICNVISYDAMICAPAASLNAQSCADLQQKIHNFCTKYDVPDYQPQVESEMILAKNPDDGSWNRATVIQICDDSTLVCFIDNGEMADVMNGQIKKMEPQFLELPIQARLCKLGGFCLDEENVDALNEFLKTVPTYTSMSAVVSEGDEQLIVEIPSLKKQLQAEGLISV